MENIEKEYKNALKNAKELPTHINGELQEHYKYFGKEKHFTKIIYDEEVTPVSIFESLNLKYYKATRFYVQNVPTYREDGNFKKMKDWDKKLMFHKAWARKDIKIKEVNFDIVGIKRATTHLPAGVLVTNINFII